MRSITSIALSLAVAAFAASVSLAQEAEGPVAAETGTLNSKKLIVFEDDLDAVEIGFALALANGNVGYETQLAEFEAHGAELQKEVVKAGMLDFVEIRNEVNAICDAYAVMKSSLAKGEKIPLVNLFSTRRHNRSDGKGLAEDWAAFKCKADMDGYYAPYAKIESKGYSRVSPDDVVEAIANLRQMIRWMERSGNWNAIANNGKTFVVKEPPQIEWAAPPPEGYVPPTKETPKVQPPQRKKIEF